MYEKTGRVLLRELLQAAEVYVVAKISARVIAQHYLMAFIFQLSHEPI